MATKAHTVSTNPKDSKGLTDAIRKVILSATRQASNPHLGATAEHKASVTLEDSCNTIAALLTQHRSLLDKQVEHDLLLFAVQEHHHPAVICFAKAGFDINIKFNAPYNPPAPDLWYLHARSPLMTVAAQGSMPTVQALLEHKADVSATMIPWHNTPMTATSEAAAHGHGAIMKRLLEAKGDANLVEEPALFGSSGKAFTLLTEVAAHCTAEEVKLLVNDYKQDVNTTVSDKTTPVMCAAGQANLSTLTALLELKADATRADNDGNTAFHHLAKAFHLCELAPGEEEKLSPLESQQLMQKRQDVILCCKKLKAAGLDIDTPNQKGQTPLMMAAMYGHLTAAQCLLNLGASLSATDARGYTAVDCALTFALNPLPHTEANRIKVANWLKGAAAARAEAAPAPAAAATAVAVEHPAAAREAVSAATLSA